MTLIHRISCLCAVGALIVATGCARAADEARVRADLQARLDRDVRPGLFRVIALRREGSAPLPAVSGRAPRVIVYFNTTLELTQDYDFGSWEQLGPSSVAFALGATEQGMLGLQPQNHAGDTVRAYGSTIYEESEGGWMPTAGAPAQAVVAEPNIEGTAPPSRSKALIDRLAALVELPPPGVPAQQDAIIAEELARASENIERRVKRREHTFTMATGPEDGIYAKFGTALIAAVNELAPEVTLRQRHSEGSVDNAFLLERGEADYAIVQGDVGAAAMAGEDVFARGGPLTSLRAIGGLFPEAIHIVVPRNSPIQDVAALRGRRVDIGAPASGTRFDALVVLAAHGLKPGDLAAAREEGFATAIGRLARGQIDALFVTSATPLPPLQQFGAQTGLRLLPLSDVAIERVTQARPGLTRLTLPANTYPGQQTPVVTVASSALLVTTSDAPQAEVERVTDLVFTRMPAQRGGNADVIKVSAENELRGVTIPLHPGATRQARGR